jgi:diadenosine tetraphosphate (Ap4A) HIT family hydrolase
MSETNCPFCTIPPAAYAAEFEHFFVLRDLYPVSPGHSLIIPKRHMLDMFELTQEEFSSLHEVLAQTKQVLEAEFTPDGYNVGVNIGEVAGQSVMHLHIHLIPRFTGDIADPRGGIRWIIPEKAPYWDD